MLVKDLMEDLESGDRTKEMLKVNPVQVNDSVMGLNEAFMRQMAMQQANQMGLLQQQFGFGLGQARSAFGF